MATLVNYIKWSATRPRARLVPGPWLPAALTYSDIEFKSEFSDKTNLSGWLIKERNTASRGVVILCHGHLGNRLEMLSVARALSKHHFTTLCFDFRARGKSAGSMCTLGLREAFDIMGAVSYVKQYAETNSLPVFVLGNSMGGASAIRAAVRDKRIEAVICEACFARLANVVSARIRLTTGPFASRLIEQCHCVEGTPRDDGFSIDEVNPVEEIGAISPRPVLLITDGADSTCPRSESDLLYTAAGGPKSRWVAPLTPHVQAFRLHPAEYTRICVEFLEHAIKHINNPPLR